MLETISRRGLRKSNKRAPQPSGRASNTRPTASSRKVAAAHSWRFPSGVVTLTKCTWLTFTSNPRDLLSWERLHGQLTATLHRPAVVAIDPSSNKRATIHQQFTIDGD